MTTQIKTTWRTVRLGSLGKVVTGKTPPTKEPDNFGGKYPFITIPDLKDQRYITRTERTVSEKGAGKLRSLKLPTNSVLMSCLATVGEAGITTKESFTNQQINAVIVDPATTDSEFVYYVFKRLKPQLAQYDGSVYTNISKTKFENIEIEIPDVIEQKRIAGILSVFDEKIENNNRIIKTLEETAQAIFKEWFVIRSSASESVFLTDLADFINGGAFGKIVNRERKGLPLVKIAEFSRGITENTEWIDENILERYKVKNGDLLFSWSGSLGLHIWHKGDAVLNQHLFNVVPKNPYTKGLLYVVLQLMLPVFRQIAESKATSMGHIQRKHLEEQEIIVPSGISLDIFEEIYQKIVLAKIENQKLSIMRDLLLPRLITGEIRV